MTSTDTGSRYSYRVRCGRHAASIGSGEKTAKSGGIFQSAATQMRSLDGKFECGNDRGKSLEVTDMIDRRKLEVLCVQETKWKGDRARALAGGYEMLHAGGDSKSNGVGIVVSEEISKDVVRVARSQGRIIVAWMMVKTQLVCIMSVYGPQVGRAETEKGAFSEELERMVGLVEARVKMCIASDCNGHGVRQKKSRSGDSDGEQESRGSRTGRTGYEKRAGRGRNILQEAGKPPDIGGSGLTLWTFHHV